MSRSLGISSRLVTSELSLYSLFKNIKACESYWFLKFCIFSVKNQYFENMTNRRTRIKSWILVLLKTIFYSPIYDKIFDLFMCLLFVLYEQILRFTNLKSLFQFLVDISGKTLCQDETSIPFFFIFYLYSIKLYIPGIILSYFLVWDSGKYNCL